MGVVQNFSGSFFFFLGGGVSLKGSIFTGQFIKISTHLHVSVFQCPHIFKGHFNSFIRVCLKTLVFWGDVNLLSFSLFLFNSFSGVPLYVNLEFLFGISDIIAHTI